MTPLDFIKLVQRRLNVADDGNPGLLTIAALDAKLPAVSAPAAAQDLSTGIDARSEKNIQTLLPQVRSYARMLITKAKEAGIEIKITSGTRTYEEQAALYAQGRTKPGPIVTRAKPGSSWHNHGCAFDFSVFQDGKYVPESPLYKKVGAIGKALGLTWGGDFQSITDEPHFELTNGKTLAQARALHDQGKNVFS